MERKCHVTASTFGKIIKRKGPSTNEFVKSICNPRNRSNLPYVNMAQKMRRELQIFMLTKCMKKEILEMQLPVLGPSVNSALPHLAASLYLEKLNEIICLRKILSR